MPKNKKMLKCCWCVFLGCIIVFSLISCGGKSGTASRAMTKKLPNGGMVDGPRSIENVEKNFALLMPRLAYFYASSQKENPAMQGMIELLCNVDAKGTVTYVNMGKSTVKDPVCIEEILTALSNHQFDAWDEGKGETVIVYPILFTSGTEETIHGKNETEKTDTNKTGNDFLTW